MSRPHASFLFCALLLVACFTPERDEGLSLRAVPFEAAGDGETQVLAIARLEARGERWFGGLSGMVLDDDVVTAVSDAGHWARFTVGFDGDGRPVAASKLEVAPLGGLDGSKEQGDAEEVTRTPDGLVVAFERDHRLLRYPDGLSQLPIRLEAPPRLDQQPVNGGAEAMAWLRDGRLVVIGEEAAGESSPLWVGGPGHWTRLGLYREGDYQPTAAAALPDGDLLVLERRFSFLAGFGARLVRVAVADLRAKTIVRGREIARFQSPLPMENYEGLGLRRRADGRLVAYLLSDDNFFPLQSTQLMAVLLP